MHDATHMILFSTLRLTKWLEWNARNTRTEQEESSVNRSEEQNVEIPRWSRKRLD